MDWLENYAPSENEKYMNGRQLAYFEKKLKQWRQQLLSESITIRKDLQENTLRQPDPFDAAQSTVDLVMDVKGLDRQRLQIQKIDRALARIESKEYGFCEMTGEEIGLKRLEVQPVATMSVEAQEALERATKMIPHRLSQSAGW